MSYYSVQCLSRGLNSGYPDDGGWRPWYTRFEAEGQFVGARIYLTAAGDNAGAPLPSPSCLFEVVQPKERYMTFQCYGSTLFIGDSQDGEGDPKLESLRAPTMFRTDDRPNLGRIGESSCWYPDDSTSLRVGIRPKNNGVWQQDTDSLFVAMPDVNQPSAPVPGWLLDQRRWCRMSCPNADYYSGDVAMIGVSENLHDGTFRAKVLNIRHGVPELLRIRVLEDGGYSLVLDGSEVGLEIEPLRWFDDWPSSRGDISDPKLTTPTAVAQCLSYTDCQPDPGKKHPDWMRYKVAATVDELGFDAFFNGPYGIRARYFIDPHMGRAYESLVVDAIARDDRFIAVAGQFARLFTTQHDGRKSSKIWSNTTRTHNGVLILNGIWEQYYLLRMNGFTPKTIKPLDLYASVAMDLLAKDDGSWRKGQAFKGIAADIGTGFDIISPWRSEDGTIHEDPDKKYRGLEISAIGFV